MGLKFGFIVGEVRESIWIEDPDLGDVPAAAAQAFAEDGEARHVEPYVRPGGKPTRIQFRPLTDDESATVKTLEMQTSLLRAYDMAFRMGCSFPDAPQVLTDAASGSTYPLVTKWQGHRVLSDGFVRHLKARYPAISTFYGRLIHAASFLTEAEKKASSPPPTPTRSVGGTEQVPTTAAQEAASGAP
jgi:hypothetical protein